MKHRVKNKRVNDLISFFKMPKLSRKIDILVHRNEHVYAKLKDTTKWYQLTDARENVDDNF